MGVEVAIGDGVATVDVENPPVNTLDDETLLALRGAASDLAERTDVRAVVLAGPGERAFLAGADLRELSHALGPEGRDGEIERHVALTRPTFDAWSELPYPVIAAVNANAVGGGLEFALLCDLIVADPRARFGLPEVTLGLIPGGGGTQRLSRRVGGPAALELVLLGRLLTAARAHEIGLVNVIAEEGLARDEALGIANRIAALPKLATQAAKRAVRLSFEAGLTAGLDAERGLFLEVARSRDAFEGATAFLEKRPPKFEHR